MSEVKDKPTEYDELTWGESGTPNTHTKPTGTMPDGWANTQLHPYDEENWLNRAMSRILKWMGEAYIREFSTLAEAIPFINAPRCFRVHPPAPMNARLSEVIDEQGVGGAVPVTHVVTDGFYIFYSQGDTVRAALPYDIAPGQWNYQPVASSNILDLACDGFRVYALIGYQAAADEIYLLNPTTGAKVVGISLLTTNCTALAVNGVWLVVLNTNTAYFYDTLGGTPVQQGTSGHGAAINAVALDATKAYIGGAQGTGPKDVRGITLSTQTEAWSALLPTVGTPTINAIATDGEYVYVGTNFVSITGGNAQLFCLRAWDGSHVWTMDDQSCDIDHLSVDDRFIYATYDTTTDIVFMIDKRNGQIVDTYSGMSGRDCDGVSVCGANGNNVMRRWRGCKTKTFMRADVNDPNRRPFHKYAVPINNGV
jgi:hypothetical protein